MTPDERDRFVEAVTYLVAVWSFVVTVAIAERISGPPSLVAVAVGLSLWPAVRLVRRAFRR